LFKVQHSNVTILYKPTTLC